MKLTVYNLHVLVVRGDFIEIFGGLAEVGRQQF